MNDLPMFNATPLPDLRAVQPDDEFTNIPRGVFRRFVRDYEQRLLALAQRCDELSNRCAVLEARPAQNGPDALTKEEIEDGLYYWGAGGVLRRKEVSERALGNRLLTKEEFAAQIYNGYFAAEQHVCGVR
jgi:hypothetical protein